MKDKNTATHTPYLFRDHRENDRRSNYTITPSLYYGLIDFDDHLEVADLEPLLIVGKSGSGKRLFLDEAVQREKQSGRPQPIEIDCSMFAGADSNLAKSWLFGHKKGSFSDATADKAGLLANASRNNDTLLILDEIGELPEEVQALLLIYIETGAYRPIGGIEEKRGKYRPRIIAATNRAEQLREELKYRFFKFQITPLHARRTDVLFFFAFHFPDLLRKMRNYQILTLLLYNWPGNMRELEHVGMKLTVWKKQMERANPQAKYDVMLSSTLSDFGMKLENHIRFTEHLKKSNIDTAKLNRYLNQYGLRLAFCEQAPLKDNEEEVTHPFDFEPVSLQETDCGKYQLPKQYSEAIERIDSGFSKFCQFLGLDASSERDITELDIASGGFGVVIKTDPNRKYSEDADEIVKTIKSIHDQRNTTKENLPLNFGDLTKLTQEELLTLYYTQLLEKTQGNKAEAARLADINYSTFKNRLKNL